MVLPSVTLFCSGSEVHLLLSMLLYPAVIFLSHSLSCYLSSRCLLKSSSSLVYPVPILCCCCCWSVPMLLQFVELTTPNVDWSLIAFWDWCSFSSSDFVVYLESCSWFSSSASLWCLLSICAPSTFFRPHPRSAFFFFVFFLFLFLFLPTYLL